MRNLKWIVVVVCAISVMRLMMLAPWLKLYIMPSTSMMSTIAPNDKILVNMSIYERQAPRYGEVAVFKAPQAAFHRGDGVQPRDVEFIKRVIGVPGQTIEIVKGRLRVNGKWVKEPWAKWNLGIHFGQGYAYDCKIVGGKVYTRDWMDNVASTWTLNNDTVPDKQQKKISLAPTESIPTNQFFLLGDNRANSNDSHVFGFVPRQLFRGRALSIVAPLNHRRSF